MKKSNSCFKSIALGFVMLAELMPGAMVYAANADTWDGTSDVTWYDSSETEFVLSTAEQLAGFSELVNDGTTFQGKTVILDSDIILNSGSIQKSDDGYSFVTENEEALKEWTPIGVYKSSSSRGFRGTFDAGNSVISGLYMDGDEDYQGLFGISYGSTIKNVRIENSLYITHDSIRTGGIIAGTPKNVGGNVTITVDNCIADVIITDNKSLSENVVAGGIVGSGRASVATTNTRVDVSNCLFKGTIDFTGDGYKSNAAGIIGESGRRGTISECVNEGNVTANNSAAGICDYSRDLTAVSGCLNSGKITSDNYAGGILGETNATLTVQYCLNTGEISGTVSGGAIAAVNNKAGTYTNNFYLLGTAPYGVKTADSEITNEAGVISSASESELKSQTVLNSLNTESVVYTVNENGMPYPKNVYFSIMYAGKYEVSGLTIAGTTNIGDVIEAKFTATGDADVLSKIKYQWWIGDGTKYELTDNAEKSLKIVAGHHKKYIKVILVLPAGETLESEPILVNIYNSDFEGTLENLEIRGILKAGNYIYFRYDSENVTDDHIADVRWYTSASESGTYKEAGARKSFKTEDTTSVRYYKVTVTLINGDEYTSQPVNVSAREAKNWGGYTAESFTDYRKEDNSDYVFTVDGHDFIMLDTIQTSDTARFKVIAKDTYGKTVYTDMDGEGFTSQLPEVVVKHVDRNVFWTGSINAWGGYMQNGYEDVTLHKPYHGFYAPGMEEVTTYKDIIGLKTYNHFAKDEAPVIWGLTTNSNNTLNGGFMYGIGTDANGTPVCMTDCNNDFGNTFGPVYEVRPMFYLDVDFFKEIKLDSSAMGAKVIEMIRNSYEKEELTDTYNKRTLEKKFGYPADYTITNAVLQDNENVNISATVEAYSNAKNATLIAAVYHEDGRMLGVSLNEITIGRGENTTLNISLSVSKTDAKNIRLSVIGGSDGLVAVTKQLELTE